MPFSPPPRRARPFSSPAAVAYLAAALILAVGTWQILRARDAALLDIDRGTRALARSLAQHAARSIEGVDLVLGGLVESLEHDALGDPGRFQAALRQGVGRLDQINSIVVLDAQGARVIGSLEGAYPAANNSDRAYYRWHRDGTGLGLYVGPAVVGRSKGMLGIPVARRWNKPDGTFGGVIVAFVSPAFFERFYDTIGLGEGAAIVLLSTGGRILVRHPHVAEASDHDVSGNQRFREILAHGGAGTTRVVSPLDGRERAGGYERVGDYPLILLAAVALDEALSPWRRDALIEGAVLGAAALALVALGLVLARHRGRVLAAEEARRASEGRLGASEARYRHLAETTRDVITHLRLPDFQRVYVSPACRTLFGCEPQEMLGRRPSTSSVHPEDAPAVRAQAERLARGEAEHVQVTYRGRHRDGHWVWIEANLNLARDGRGDGSRADHAGGQAGGHPGEPALIVCTLRDVTERQRHAEELRTAKRDAEAAARAKSEFLAAMSHEIRTPLNGVIGYADLLADEGGLSARQSLQVARVRSAGQALMAVVDDILDFSRIEAGRVEIEARPVDLAGLVEESATITRGAAQGKGLDLAVAIDSRAARRVLADRDRLRQVLLNLLTNAIKFTREGGVTLSLDCACADPGAESGEGDGTCRVRFAVVDTGIGIPPDKRDRLFQRFSQVDGSITREFGGTGLGLAISQRLVGLMGGTIEVESEPHRGSRFHFTLRLARADAAAPPTDADPLGRAPHAVEDGVEDGVEDAVASGGRARVLVVEDVALNRELARSVLERAGHAVEVVGDGADAVMAVGADAYDVVLMDVQMPGLDGLSATRAIRALAGRAGRVPIVAMTANVLPAQAAACRAAGMDDVLAKPFRREALDAMVRRWAAGRADAPVDGTAGPAVRDADRFEGVRGLVGPARADEMLAHLAALIAERLGEGHLAPADLGHLARQAHALVAPAGQLGFAELSERCAELEAACLQGREVAALLHQVGSARQRALEAITALRRAA